MPTVILDGNNLAMRSFHAAKGRLTSTDGIETGSLQLFVNSLSRAMYEFRPTHFICYWDGGHSAFREGIYPEYKAARKTVNSGTPGTPHREAFGLISEFLRLNNLHQARQEGVEADDLIAAAVRQTRQQRPDDIVVIMSSDKDLLQLLDRKTMQYRFSSYNTPNDLWTDDRVRRDLGYSPEQIPLVMALTGDPGDGIPGVKGIGPKKAIKLLDEHRYEGEWNFDYLIQQLDGDSMMQAALSRQLVDLAILDWIVVDPVPEYDPISAKSDVYSLEALTDFCARYQLRTIWEKIIDHSLWW